MLSAHNAFPLRHAQNLIYEFLDEDKLALRSGVLYLKHFNDNNLEIIQVT